MTKEVILNKNYTFFKKKLPELLSDENNKNKFALICNQEIIGIYHTFEQAINVAKEEKNFELETFIIQKIEDQKHFISRILYQFQK